MEQFYFARYRDAAGLLKIACDARGQPIRCATAELAASVALYRSARTLPGFTTELAQ